MESFNPETDSVLLQKWWIDLNLDQAEFEDLFTKPLRNLSAIGFWMAQKAKFFYEADGKGIWFAAWVTPLLTNGAEVGAWIRKDRRASKQALQAIDFFYDETVLKQVPTLIGLTRQYPALHELHLKLGYTYVDEFPGVFDGRSVWMYKMTRESRAGRFAVRQALREQKKANHVSRNGRIQVVDQREQPQLESIRRNASPVRDLRPEGRTASLARAVESGKRSIKDWWYNKPNPDHEPAG